MARNPLRDTEDGLNEKAFDRLMTGGSPSTPKASARILPAPTSLRRRLLPEALADTEALSRLFAAKPLIAVRLFAAARAAAAAPPPAAGPGASPLPPTAHAQRALRGMASEVEEQIARAERESREGDREADYPAQRESEGGRGGRWNREGTEV